MHLTYSIHRGIGPRPLEERTGGAIAVAVLAVAAGAIAAASGTSGTDDHHKSALPASTSRRGVLQRPSELEVAAGYLGLTPTQVRAQLRAGRTLAQIAEAADGRSAGGLLDALVRTRADRLRATIAAHGPSAARAARRLARLRRRVAAQIDGVSDRPTGEAVRKPSRQQLLLT